MIPVKVRAVRYLSSVPEALGKALGTREACLGWQMIPSMREIWCGK